MAEKVMVIGVDESEHSFYALDWTLQHFFGPNATPYKLTIVNATLPSTPHGVAFLGSPNLMPTIDADLKKTNSTVQRAKDICIEHKVQSVETEVVEGDARHVLCDSVDKFHASILVVGSHDYGVVKKMGLGSVSDYCAQHAHCCVMIVKRPPKPMS
ncbi:universal stress protein A-like protein [Cucumis melo var. makuwa]|uniref:Uncharacterized protein LOC103483847 isoform X2 n=3 Tax=Cucumis melo TaxID=3656 RepID=A0A1S3AXF8_CUCME|nr:universal stress protein PHOS32-like [Cucumis melo]XP_008438889.1 universal stress protein PHOS32-like [Cucumis melo]KAA0049500.1 universal stress protein A-like protein [Cucumis melo var. makuwa]TYK16180.1 universal stress protein A-like protein [Cucumis melo var. makuwa]